MRIVFMTVLLLFFITGVQAADMKEETVNFGSFGDVHLYCTSDKPDNMVLFISGDGGWNLGVIDMAKELASTGALVAGIDIIHYLKELGHVNGQCSYPAAHFESLSQFLQQKYGFELYKLPVLVGYSSGATLVYTTLAQSPDNTFQGGISLGFCPELSLAKPLCKGNGSLTFTMDKKKTNTYIFDAVKQLPAPWVALQGEIDQVCFPEATKAYVEKVGNGSIIMLQKVGHGYSVPKNWMPQFKKAYADITAKPEAIHADKHPIAESLSDLPLVELHITASGDKLAIIVTGDGGWAGIDKSIGEELNKEGIAVIGFNSLQYYWTRKDPEQSAKDMGRIIEYYSKAWNRSDIILIGYSRGADVLPFIVNRLDLDARTLVKEVVLLGQETTVDFQFHVTDWLTSGEHEEARQVMPEMQKLGNQNVLCIYGSEEKGNSLCTQLDKNKFRVVEMKGGHHFGGDYEKLSKIILEHVK
ncbi:hypothetical protein N9W34_00085 [Rickettsiales bacterium]|nr:hypothetical protein [Rickettsiales bacterium]